MFILGYLLMAVARVLDFALLFLMVFVIARAVLSWVSPDPYNPIVRFIHNVTEPILFRIRKNLPVVLGGIDFSPIIVFLAIMFLRDFLVNSLMTMSRSLL
jgi:YggT family protein